MQRLSAYQLPWPVNWSALFNDPPIAPRPLIVEIGFGRGTYLLHLAKQRPYASIIGLEIANRCLTAAENAIRRERLANVRVIHARAETALHHLFTPASIAQVHMNFPDPWFKPGHSHRRLMQRDTLDAIISRLAPGGELYLATDILAYAEMSADLLAETPQLDNLLPDRWVNRMPGRITTKYEAIAQAEGRTCYYFACRRNDQPAPPVPVIEDLPMPHIVFTSPLTLDDIHARFEPSHYSHGETHIHFMSAYLGKNGLLIETHVGEPTITQRIALLVSERGSSEYTLQMSMLGQPRATAGVHRAVTLLGDWLLALDPAAKIIKRKVASE